MLSFINQNVIMQHMTACGFRLSMWNNHGLGKSLLNFNLQNLIMAFILLLKTFITSSCVLSNKNTMFCIMSVNLLVKVIVVIWHGSTWDSSVEPIGIATNKETKIKVSRAKVGHFEFNEDNDFHISLYINNSGLSEVSHSWHFQQVILKAHLICDFFPVLRIQ